MKIDGLPEANEAAGYLYNGLLDSNNKIRPMAAVWCSGSLGDFIPEKNAKKLIELLKDLYKLLVSQCPCPRLLFIG